MVFASPSNDGLVTVHLDGSGRRQITTGHADFAANWAPNGNDLVFTRSDEADRDVYVAHSDGSAIQRMTSTPDRFEFAPVWSPDGEKIAFVGCPVPSSGADCLLYVVSRNGIGETQLSSVEVSGGEGAVDWQPLASEPGEWKTLGTLRYREQVIAGDLVVDFEERGLNRFSVSTTDLTRWSASFASRAVKERGNSSPPPSPHSISCRTPGGTFSDP